MTRAAGLRELQDRRETGHRENQRQGDRQRKGGRGASFTTGLGSGAVATLQRGNSVSSSLNFNQWIQGLATVSSEED